jgi:ankyrin repeat protein
MNRDILNIILNDVLYNDINSIKKTSLICKNIHNNIQILAQTNEIKSKLSILHRYIHIGMTKVYDAIKYGYIDIVKLMINQEIHIWNMSIPNTLRRGVALRGHINISQIMIETGGLCNNNRYDWNDMMMKAAESGHMNIVQLMIEKGAQRSMDWNGSMCHAAFGGRMNIVQFMIEKGANRWNEAMRYAAYGGHINIVQLMIEKGANNWKDAIYWATDYTDIIELLKYHQSKKFD